MKCWNCGAELALLRKISFRETCEQCHASLHCCCNCLYHKPGLPNDCMIPNTESIADRTANNFCDEFKIFGKGPEQKINPNKIAKKLFRDEDRLDDEIDPKKRFDNLFGD